MSDKELPVPAETLPERPPQSSADRPTKAKLQMYVAAIPVNVVWGAVAHYVGIAITYLTLGVFLLYTFAQRTCALGKIGMLIVAGIFALLAAVGVPVAAGRVGGGIVSRLCQLGRCRSAGVTGRAAVANGIAVYAGHLLVTLITAGRLQPLITIYTRKLSDDLAIQVTHDNPWWIAVVIVVELLMVIVGAYVEAAGSAENATDPTDEDQALA